MPASVGRGPSKTGGGKNVVAQWVEKFDVPPLSEMFRGIIDLDVGNAGAPRVHVLGRYSIENYQLDPMIIFGVLLQEKIAPPLPGIGISAGDEHRLRELAGSELQVVVDFVRQQIGPKLGSLTTKEQANAEVTFTNDLKVSYPSWMLNRPGKDLMPIYQKVFGQHLITPPNLLRMQRRIRLVPIELAEIMIRLQQS